MTNVELQHLNIGDYIWVYGLFEHNKQKVLEVDRKYGWVTSICEGMKKPIRYDIAHIALYKEGLSKFRYNGFTY